MIFSGRLAPLWDADAIRDIAELIQALRDQGGYPGRVVAVDYLTSLKDSVLREVPNGVERNTAWPNPCRTRPCSNCARYMIGSSAS